MDDDRSEPENDPPLADLDAGLRERLRRGGGDRGALTHAELLELADALNRQRHDIAEALTDLRRREAEAARVRTALEETSRSAEAALDERDARLSAAAAELEAERARLEGRALELGAAEDQLARRVAERAAAAPAAPAPEPEAPRGLESVLADLRERMERVEAALELRERLDRVEAAIAGRVRAVREHAPVQIEERLARLEELVGELAAVVRAPLEAVRTREASAQPPPVEAVRTREASAQPPPREDVAEEPLPPVEDPVETPEPALPAQAPAGHVLFVSDPTGYRLVEREGAAPAAGELLTLHELGGVEAVASGPRSSPFPGDRRPCLACTVVDEPPRTDS